MENLSLDFIGIGLHPEFRRRRRIDAIPGENLWLTRRAQQHHLWLGFLLGPRKLHPLRPHGRVEELPSKPGRPFLLVVNLRRRSIVLEPVGPRLEDTRRERAYMCRHVFLQPFSGASPSPTFRCIPASAIPGGASSAREPLAPVDSNARALHSLQFTHQL